MSKTENLVYLSFFTTFSLFAANTGYHALFESKPALASLTPRISNPISQRCLSNGNVALSVCKEVKQDQCRAWNPERIFKTLDVEKALNEQRLGDLVHLVSSDKEILGHGYGKDPADSELNSRRLKNLNTAIQSIEKKLQELKERGEHKYLTHYQKLLEDMKNSQEQLLKKRTPEQIELAEISYQKAIAELKRFVDETVAILCPPTKEKSAARVVMPGDAAHSYLSALLTAMGQSANEPVLSNKLLYSDPQILNAEEVNDFQFNGGTRLEFPESSQKFRTAIFDFGKLRAVTEVGSVHSPRPVAFKAYALSEEQIKKGPENIDYTALTPITRNLEDPRGTGYLKEKLGSAVETRFIALRWEPDYNPPAFLVFSVTIKQK